MTHSYGLRSGTRNKFSKAFRKHGAPNTSRYMTTYRMGEFVTIIADPSIHKGMPFQFYHGRTGKVFNVTKRAIGVELDKIVGNRKIRKRIHVRIEHVRKSRCQEDFKQRCRENAVKIAEAKKTGVKVCLKRSPAMPKPGKMVILGSDDVVHDLEVKPHTEHFV